MTGSTEPQTFRTPLWIRAGLILSLTVNLAIVGVVAGALLSDEGPRADRVERTVRETGALPFLRAFEPGDRRAVARRIQSEREALRAGRAEMRATMDAFLDALVAEPFDAAAVADLAARQRAATAERQKIGERALIGHLSTMTPEARAAYAARLAEDLHRRDTRDRK